MFALYHDTADMRAVYLMTELLEAIGCKVSRTMDAMCVDCHDNKNLYAQADAVIACFTARGLNVVMAV